MHSSGRLCRACLSGLQIMLDVWDMISCTGTSFIIRADAGQMVDWVATLVAES